MAGSLNKLENLGEDYLGLENTDSVPLPPATPVLGLATSMPIWSQWLLQYTATDSIISWYPFFFMNYQPHYITEAWIFTFSVQHHRVWNSPISVDIFEKFWRFLFLYVMNAVHYPTHKIRLFIYKIGVSWNNFVLHCTTYNKQLGSSIKKAICKWDRTHYHWILICICIRYNDTDAQLMQST